MNMINYNNLQDFFAEDDGEQEKQLLIEKGIKPFVKQRFLTIQSDDFFNENCFYIALRDFSGMFSNIDLDTIKDLMIECIYEETDKLANKIRLVHPQILNQISTRPKDRKR